MEISDKVNEAKLEEVMGQVRSKQKGKMSGNKLVRRRLPNKKYASMYDSENDISYIAAKKHGVKYGFVVQGEAPAIKEDEAWTIEDLRQGIEGRVLFEKSNGNGKKFPIASYEFRTGKVYEIPNGTDMIRIKKGRITFCPEGMYKDLDKKTTYHKVPENAKEVSFCCVTMQTKYK